MRQIQPGLKTLTVEEYDQLIRDRAILDWLEADFARTAPPRSTSLRNKIGRLLGERDETRRLLAEGLAAWDCRNALTPRSKAPRTGTG